MFKEGLIKCSHFATGSAVDKHTIKNIHTYHLVAKMLDIAGCRLRELLTIVAQIDAFTTENGVVTACYSDNIKFQTATMHQFFILGVNLGNKISANSTYTAYKQVKDLIFTKEERVVQHV